MEPIRLFNVDVNGYVVNSPMAMYGCIPYLLARDSSRASSLFWNNPSETWVDTSEERHGVLSRFVSEGGFIDFHLFLGPTAADALQSYTRLTGRPQLPPAFSLGFHQSRWGYKTSAEVRDVMKHLDDAQIPHDAIWLDLDHTDDKMWFTFHPHNFKDAEKLQDEIDPLERKLIVLCDPHLRVDYSYPIFSKAFNSRFLIRTRLDSDYTAECWPGDSVWVDFVNPWARLWWETLHEFPHYAGSTLSLYIWNDMNEPSVFNVPDRTVPKDTVHYHHYEHREVHNVYGGLMISATWGGLKKRDYDEDDRPFILTRSFFAGSQRYAFTWTGDNTADWSHLRASLAMVLSLGIAGMPFAGADVGGFFGSPGPVLLVRWYQLAAAVYPFFRCHCHHDGARREPYTLSGAQLDAVRRAIAERYALAPYWYTEARRANVTGCPIVRPLWWEFPNDRRFADVEDRVMIGGALLVVPALEEFESERRVQVPFVRWFDFRSLEERERKDGVMVVRMGLQEIPVFVRGGCVVLLKVWRRRTVSLQFRDPFVMVVALDENGEAVGELYVDDGVSFRFAKGEFVHRRFGYSAGVLSGRQGGPIQERGEFFGDYDCVIERVRIAGLSAAPIVRDPNGRQFETEWKNGVLTIHRANLSVKENWAIGFQFEGQPPPILPDTGGDEEEVGEAPVGKPVGKPVGEQSAGGYVEDDLSL
jgi:alpha 1,3-glucosidase